MGYLFWYNIFMIRVLVFGDSIVYGGWDTEGGWVDRVKREAHKATVDTDGETRIQVFNLGIGGDTSRKILARIRGEIEARLSKTWDTKIILSFGINDGRTKDGVVEVPLDEYRENSQKIIEIAKSYTDKLLVVGNPPIGDEIVIFKAFEYSDERNRQYDMTLREVAEAAGVSFLSSRELFEEANKGSLNAYDELHLNNDGHEIIAGAVKPFVLN